MVVVAQSVTGNGSVNFSSFVTYSKKVTTAKCRGGRLQLSIKSLETPKYVFTAFHSILSQFNLEIIHSMAVNANSDPTFRNYKTADAAKYAANRASYPEQLIRMIVDAHTSTGGQTGLLLDVGCGPGIATRQLAAFFENVIGVDPGQSMIEAARSIPAKAKSGNEVRYEVYSAEELDKIAEPNSVDIITAATAAHWFDLPKFYTIAARLLKPNGSVIVWVSGDYFCDDDTPNAEEVRKMWQQCEDMIEPYELPGNRLCRKLYADLDMPWSIKSEDASVREALSQFDRTSSSREVFNAKGQKDDRFVGGYLRHTRAPISKLKAMLSTASPVTRWREANKEKIENGEVEDYVEKCARLTKETMAKVPGGEKVEEMGFASGMVMIVIKRK